jgi:hypothetical protein
MHARTKATHTNGTGPAGKKKYAQKGSPLPFWTVSFRPRFGLLSRSPTGHSPLWPPTRESNLSRVGAGQTGAVWPSDDPVSSSCFARCEFGWLCIRQKSVLGSLLLLLAAAAATTTHTLVCGRGGGGCGGSGTGSVGA